jgi:transposase
MRETLYSSDLTDAQWEILEPLLPVPAGFGRPPHPARQIIDAIFYNLRTGCQWRLLPKEFGPWQTVYGRFRLWKKNGVWTALNDRLRAKIRVAVGKRCRPTAAILDSQTVRSSDHTGNTGYDAAKKTKGRKRHLLVDTLGLILGVMVTSASTPEGAGAQALLARVLIWLTWLRLLWVDSGYSGQSFARWVRTLRQKLKVEVVKRLSPTEGFRVLPRRWIVERTFGWLMKQRRLVRNYKVTDSSAEAWVYIAMIRIMLRRLA